MAQKLFIALLIVLAVLRIRTNPSLVDGQRVSLKGVVANDPKHTQFKTYFKVGSVNVVVKKDLLIKYGQSVELKGVYSQGFLEVEEISYDNKLLTLSEIRAKLVNNVRSHLHEPHASLVSGIFLGSRPSISAFEVRLKEVGLSHVVVASGGNIALVLAIFSHLLSGRIGRKYLIILLPLAIFTYMLLSGFGPPIVRAGVMVGLVFLSQLLGRPSATLRILFLAIVFCIILFPYWINDISFMLSASATWGLIYLSPKIANKLRAFPEFLKIGISTTISAQIATAPIIIFYFNNFQPLSVFYNLLVVWVTPFIFLIGLFGSVFYFVSPALSGAILYLSLPFTSWFNFVVGI
jgi:competence protein ComEC